MRHIGQEGTNLELQTPADVARTIRTQRLIRELSQQQLADAVGITRQSLVRIEKAQGSTSFHTILRIFHQLGITLHAATESKQATLAPKPTRAESSWADFVSLLNERSTVPDSISSHPQVLEALRSLREQTITPPAPPRARWKPAAESTWTSLGPKLSSKASWWDDHSHSPVEQDGDADGE